MEQFVTRFLLRETMNQLQSLQVSLECAADTIEEQAGRERYKSVQCVIAVLKSQIDRELPFAQLHP